VSLAPARAALVVAAALVLVLGFAVLGRAERKDANRTQVEGIVSVAGRAGAVAPSAYRITAWADCLLYPIGADPYALEVCYDRLGRAVEAIDRHDRARTRVWSVRYDPELSTVFDSPVSLFRTFKRLGAFPDFARYPGRLPLAADVRLPDYTAGDSGPILVREPE
jgi:hypothetical protein